MRWESPMIIWSWLMISWGDWGLLEQEGIAIWVLWYERARKRKWLHCRKNLRPVSGSWSRWGRSESVSRRRGGYRRGGVGCTARRLWSPSEILPPAPVRQSRSFSKRLCHNIYVFRFGECIAFWSRKIWKGWWWEFPQHVDFCIQLDPRLTAHAKPDCHLLTRRKGGLALFYC